MSTTVEEPFALIQDVGNEAVYVEVLATFSDLMNLMRKLRKLQRVRERESERGTKRILFKMGTITITISNNLY